MVSPVYERVAYGMENEQSLVMREQIVFRFIRDRNNQNNKHQVREIHCPAVCDENIMITEEENIGQDSC